MSAEVVQAPPDAPPVSEAPAMTTEDVRKLNKRLAWLRAKQGGLRAKRAFFRCPWPCTRRQYEQYRDAAVEKWIASMDREGWDLKSKVAVDANKRRSAHGYSGDWATVALLEQVEVPVAAFFQKRKVEKAGFEVLVRQ